MRLLSSTTLLGLQVLLGTLSVALANSKDINDQNRLIVPQHETTSHFKDAEFPGGSSSNTSFQVTAVLNSPSPPYHAIIECWALAAPFNVYPTVGVALALGDVSNATYVVLPPRSGEGWHRPPANMYFVLLSGAAHVHAPKPNSSTGMVDKLRHGRKHAHAHEHLYIKPGWNQLIIAVDSDLRAPGHLTYYPGDTETVALQIPFFNGVIPDHVFVRPGACEGPTDDAGEHWWV
ncbi:hypothetical protein LTR84_001717 [Exophiala bonariae]|uniref:Cupin type-1 domain-containing protein n=1 Tax=Exophiala bonariae TaxID=1690606 RepID=A0AAV9NEX0_9EURO|nr:hypothetical protein LTR84_001717 [Exophiala bonariae]